MVKEVKKIEVNIEPIRTQILKVPIRGKTALLMDKFPEDVKQEILQKQSGSSQKMKKIRNIDKEVEDAIHYTQDRKGIGFPAFAFKAGMVECTAFVGNTKYPTKKLLRGIKIINAIDGLVPIKFKKKDILEHSVGSNTKFTPRFHDWSCELHIEFDKNNLSEGDLIYLINYAGYYYGIGSWSPRCGGDYGFYEVDKNKVGEKK